MKTNEDSINPVLSLTSKNVKNDLLIFKDEALKDFKEAQKKISEKYKKLDFEVREKLDSYERRINVYEGKIMELSKMINTDKTIRERVDKLMEFKVKVDDSMLTEKIRLDNTRNDLYHNVNRIDDILKDSVIYPGVIGGISRYKTFHEFIDYVLTQCSQNLTFREKSIIDFKNYKERLENTISSFNSQITKLLNTTSEYTKTCVKECEDRMKSIYNVYDDRLQDARIENANYAIGLEKATESLKKELENLYIVKNELYKKVDNGIIEMKNDNTRVIKLFIGYKKGFTLLQHKFTQLSEFIKETRFRYNLKEDVSRREFAHMSDMINFDKRKKGFMDGVYDNTNYLKKGLESQLKDYISGKIKADEIFKKRDTSKNINKIQIKQNININSINVNESNRRKSLSQSMNKLNSLSEFNDDIKYNTKSLLRGSISFQNRKSLENIFSKIDDPEKIKKDIIKEEEEDENNSSKDIINYKKVLTRKNTQVVKLKKDLNKVLSEKNSIEKINEDKKELSEERKKKLKNEDSKIQIISKDKDISNSKSMSDIKNLAQPRTSLKNIIQDIFNAKNIMENMRKEPNSSISNINKEERITNLKTKNIKDLPNNLESEYKNNNNNNKEDNNKEQNKEDNKKININKNNDKNINNNIEKDIKKNNIEKKNNNENKNTNDNKNNSENKKNNNENKNNENNKSKNNENKNTENNKSKNNENKNTENNKSKNNENNKSKINENKNTENNKSKINENKNTENNKSKINENKNTENNKSKNEKINFKNNINIESKSENNKLIKSSSEIDFKNKTLNEHKFINLNLNNNKNIELNIKKDYIKYRPNSKEKESNNNKIISSSIKKKLLNPELNKVVFNGKTLNNITNNKKKSNSTQKNNNLIFKSNKKNNTNYKSFNILKRDDNLIVTNYIPKNDINVDEINYLKFKKKNNL